MQDIIDNIGESLDDIVKTLPEQLADKIWNDQDTRDFNYKGDIEAGKRALRKANHTLANWRLKQYRDSQHS